MDMSSIDYYTKIVKDLIFQTDLYKGYWKLWCITLAVMVVILLTGFLMRKLGARTVNNKGKQDYLSCLSFCLLSAAIILAIGLIWSGLTLLGDYKTINKYKNEDSIVVATDDNSSQTVTVIEKDIEKATGEKHGVKVSLGEKVKSERKVLRHTGAYLILNEDGKSVWQIKGDYRYSEFKRNTPFPEDRVFKISYNDLAKQYQHYVDKYKDTDEFDEVSDRAKLMMAIRDLVEKQKN